MRSAQAAADQRMAGIITRDSTANFNAAQQEATRNKQLLDAENERQKSYQQQVQALQNESIRRNSADNMNQLLAAKTAEGSQRYGTVADQAAQSAGLPSASMDNVSNSTRVVQDSLRNQLSKASDYLRGVGNARAGMEAFNNALLDQNIGMQQANGQIGKLGSMADISRNAFNSEYGASNNMSNLLFGNIARNTGYDTTAANVAAQSGYNNALTAGQGWQTAGALLGSGAQLAGMYGSFNGWQNPTLAANRNMLAGASATNPNPNYQPGLLSSRPVPIR
jgi:hypothetical protein